MVGSLLHAARATRPDIAHAVGIVSKFNAAPTQAHLTAVKRIFRYLKGTIDLKLQYRSDGEICLGTLMQIGQTMWMTGTQQPAMSGGAISWLSQKQTTVVLSKAEAKYIALGSATQEAIWLHQFLNDLKVDTKGSIEIMEDNQSTIAIAKSSIGHKRTKHIDIKQRNSTSADWKNYCPTADMLADIFTKQLPKTQFEKLRNRLGSYGLKTITNRGAVLYVYS